MSDLVGVLVQMLLGRYGLEVAREENDCHGNGPIVNNSLVRHVTVVRPRALAAEQRLIIRVSPVGSCDGGGSASMQ